MNIFTSRTSRRVERVEDELAQTRDGLQGSLAELAQSVKALHDLQLPGFERQLALQNERDEYAASDEVLREELAAAKEGRETLDELLQAAHRNNEDLRKQIAETHRAVDTLCTAVIGNSAGAAQQAAASVIAEHFQALGLFQEQRKAAVALLPRVSVLLSYGRIHSVHSSMDAAKAASPFGDSGWDDKPLTSQTRLRDVWQVISTLPVNGPWTDRTSITLVLDAEDEPVAAYGDHGPQHVDDTHSVEIHAVEKPADAAAA